MTDSMKEPERFADKERNLILNKASTDLERIIRGHNPEIDTSLNNGVWDCLDKMAVQIEQLSVRRALPDDAGDVGELAALTPIFDIVSNIADNTPDSTRLGLAWSTLTAGEWREAADTITALQAKVERLRKGVDFTDWVWTEKERDRLAKVFSSRDGRTGHYETLFAVAAEGVRIWHRRQALANAEGVK